MSISGRAYIAGAYEHPTRKAPDKSVAQLHAEVAAGALADAGLTKDDVDGYFCAGDAPGLGPAVDGRLPQPRPAPPRQHRSGRRLLYRSRGARRPGDRHGQVQRRSNHAGGTAAKRRPFRHGGGAAVIADAPDSPWEAPFGPTTVNLYAMCARRHMYEFGTTPEQLAWIKVAASHHAQHNPHAMLRDVVSVDDVLASPVIADPLHRLDCCVVSDGGGALVVVRPEIARSLKRPLVRVMGAARPPRGSSAARST